MKLETTDLRNNGLKPFKVPDGLVLIQDTREQRPLFTSPPEGLEVVRDALPYGDYSLRGFEDEFCIERKQLSDFYAYIGRERHRTLKKMEEFRSITSSGGFVGLVIETTEADLLAGYIMTRVSPETARQALISFEMRYGVHVYYSRSRNDIARWILDRAIKFYQIQRETYREAAI
jgi:ERCC4-type nuclease